MKVLGWEEEDTDQNHLLVLNINQR